MKSINALNGKFITIIEKESSYISYPAYVSRKNYEWTNGELAPYALIVANSSCWIPMTKAIMSKMDIKDTPNVKEYMRRQIREGWELSGIKWNDALKILSGLIDAPVLEEKHYKDRFEYACYKGEVDVAHSILSFISDIGSNPIYLCSACREGHKDMVQFLLDNGANPHLTMKSKDGPINCLYLAAINHDYMPGKRKAYMDIIHILLSLGVSRLMFLNNGETIDVTSYIKSYSSL